MEGLKKNTTALKEEAATSSASSDYKEVSNQELLEIEDIIKTNNKEENRPNTDLPSDEESEEELGEGLQRVVNLMARNAVSEKRIDMKALETKIYEIFVHMHEEETTEADSEKAKCQETRGTIKFSCILKELMKKISPEDAKNLSYGIALSALLQVASDYNLLIEGTPELSDITVSQDNKL